MASSSPKTRDDSSISALADLMRLEAERIAEDSTLRAHEAKLRADAEAATRLVRLEEERARSEALRAAEELAERERHAKELEARERERAASHALEVNARETRARDAAAREHEIALRTLELETLQARGSSVSWAGYAAAAVVLAASLAAYLGYLAPHAEARVAAASRLVEQRGADVTRLEGAVASERSRSSGLSGELAEERARRAAVEAELGQLRLSRREPPATPKVLPKTRPTLGSGEDCLTGDPMCFSLRP